MPRLRPKELPKFTKAEIEHMEVLLKLGGEESLCPEFCEKLAKKFSLAEGRSGKPAIQWDQVQSWFRMKQKTSKGEVAPITSAPIQTQTVIPSKERFDTASNPSISNTIPETSAPSKGEKLPDISDLEFEAKSSKDEAWYDVAHFLTHRVLSSGEPEVRVRFVGFGAEEDEWVNVKTGVRERSLPLESSECHKVNVGDLVLCFHEKRDQAIYYDAHVLEIQKKLHDVRGCRCLFLVRYVHDNTEERVQLRRLCCRPSY
ncbi:Sawadee homeodomain-like protein [Thalictrum thalictroides]|uniref:Sawadee homeodomain-like protein n=1 Tax=Thalictrum thalictroides TaxID=46969 RepID=A0A7J6WQ30_THATH|nr:Sawadee homeodomain-like protein [Thalictrum thalictroides]